MTAQLWTIMTLVAIGFFLLGYWCACDDYRRYMYRRQ